MILRLLFVTYLFAAETVLTEVAGLNSTNANSTTNSSDDTPVSWINKELPSRRQWGPMNMHPTTVESDEKVIGISPLPALNKTKIPNMVQNYVISSNPGGFYNMYPNSPPNNGMFQWNTRPPPPPAWHNMYTTQPPNYVTTPRPRYTTTDSSFYTTQGPYTTQPDVPINDIINKPEQYQGICDIYLKNLLRMWKIISQFISDEDNANVDVTQLPNMFKLLGIYIRIKNEQLDPVSNNNLRTAAMNILADDPKEMYDLNSPFMKSILPSNPHLLNLNPNSNPENNFLSQSMPLKVGIPSDKTKGLTVSAPVPQSKCQEMALDSLIETFRKLYQEYMKHLVECEQKVSYLSAQ